MIVKVSGYLVCQLLWTVGLSHSVSTNGLCLLESKGLRNTLCPIGGKIQTTWGANQKSLLMKVGGRPYHLSKFSKKSGKAENNLICAEQHIIAITIEQKLCNEDYHTQVRLVRQSTSFMCVGVFDAPLFVAIMFSKIRETLQ